MLTVGISTEVGAQLRTYATLLPLGLYELDRVIAAEAADNPWLEVIDRPVQGLGYDELRIAATAQSLSEHLETQLAGRRAAGPLLRAARYVIGALDEHAYLRDDADAVARLAHVAEIDARRAIALVQRLEPTGVAARSLGERFRLQLAEAKETTSLAFRVTFELDALAAEGSAAFAAKRSLTDAELSGAMQRLRSCDPDPARDYRCPVDRIYPEIIVTREGANVGVSVDGRFWPDIRLASLEVTRGLSEPMRNARARARLIVDALARRKTTLERLALALLNLQRNYFMSNGETKELVPLSGRQLAREVGCAESTISRALADRYAATPFGTIPLRSLLARRPASVGLTVAAVREQIREIAQASPTLSDDAIARTLRMRGVRLARRTIAKYRHELGLASSRSRSAP